MSLFDTVVSAAKFIVRHGTASVRATDPTVTAGTAAPTASEAPGSVYLRATVAPYFRLGSTWYKVALATKPSTADLIADPGNGQAIPVTDSGVCAITTAGAETRTLAIPTFVNQRLALVIDVDGGTCVVTSAQAFNQAGNNTLTMADVNDFVELVAVKCAGGNLRWRLVVADGVTPTTV